MITVFRTAVAIAAGLCVGLAIQAQDWKEIERHYLRAQEALRDGKSEVATQEFREILRLQPSNAQAHANLGVISFTGKDYAGAAKEFRAALELQSPLWNATAFLGMSERHLGHPVEAKQLLADSLSHLEDRSLQRQVGISLISLCYESGDLDKTLDVLRVLEAAKPSSPDVLYMAYRAYSDLAAKALASLAETAPESAQMYQILAQNLASRDEFKAAIVQYRRAIELDGQLTGLHYELAQTILADSTEEAARNEAQKEFQRELALNPASADSEYMLGVIAWLRGEPKDSLEHCLAALKLRNDFVDAHIAAGKALRALHRPDEAVKHLEAAVQLDPRNEVAHYRLAEEYRELGRDNDATREAATFHQLRDMHQQVRALYQAVLQRPTTHETIEPGAQKP